MAIPIKNAQAIARMRETCAIAATVLHTLKQAVQPGITTFDLEELARKLIASHGARSACYNYPSSTKGIRPFPAHACISVNDEVVHGIGSIKRILRPGDIVSLDIVLEYNGYIGDNATTVPVGQIAPRAAELLRVTREALDLGIAQATPGNRIGDISATIQRHVEKHGFGVVREMVGHGVGLQMHEEPQIPNFADRKKTRTDIIRPGMTLAIEPMINQGTWRTKVAPDGWTVLAADSQPSAHYEHPGLTTHTGPEILKIPRTS
jgi:methionyl aminopeptidase